MIRKATERDIDAVEASYTELLTYEQEHGTSSNWVLNLYPTRTVAEAALAEGTLYVLEENGIICASMILNDFQPEDYAKIKWLYLAAPSDVLVIHTLCIPPSQSGRGYGRAMVQYAVDLAREQGCKVLRLDTWAENKPAALLYEKQDFRYAGTASVLLQGVIPEEQVFFEYKI